LEVKIHANFTPDIPLINKMMHGELRKLGGYSQFQRPHSVNRGGGIAMASTGIRTSLTVNIVS